MKDQLTTYDDVYNIVMNNIVASNLRDSVNENKLVEFCQNTSTELIKKRNQKIELYAEMADRMMWGTD